MFENKKVAKYSKTNHIEVFKAISINNQKIENRTSEKKNQKTKIENIKSAANAENLLIHHVYQLKETWFYCAQRAPVNTYKSLYSCTLRDHKHVC